MAKRGGVTFETVKEMGLQLPGTELGTSYGSPAIKAGGRVLACIASNKQADPDSIYVSLGFPERDELVEADPSVYYLRDHYVPWPCVLVRLNRVSRDALRDLLAMSHAYVMTTRRKSGRTQHGRPALSKPRRR